MGVYPGSSKREDNHSNWEKKNAKQAIKAKGKYAMGVRAAGQSSGKSQNRNSRNNRREY
jgi:hypothetical protein